MKACVLEELGEMEYKNVPKPDMKTNEVLVQVKACGICSSDLDRVFNTGAYHYPIILGHEISGQIVDIADNRNESYIGKKVVVFPLLPCFKCEACQKGFYAQCNNYNYYGSRCNGGFAEYLSVPLWNIKTFSDDINYEIASLCEPSAVAWHSVSDAEIKRNDKVLILGSGLIGIMVGFFAQSLGAQVYFKVRNYNKQNFLKQLGFKNIYKEINNTKFDTCFECVGTNEAIQEALKFVQMRGKIVLVGNPKSDICFDKNLYWKILRQEINLKGVWNSQYPKDWDYVLTHIKEFPMEKLITHKFKLSDGFNAFKILKDAEFKIKGVFCAE